MPVAPLITVALVTSTSVLGSALVSTGGTAYAPSAGVLVAAGALALTIVASAGLLISHSPWARRVLGVITVMWLGVCLTAEIGPLSIAVVAMAAASIAALAGPWLGPWLRRLPASGSPPPLVAVILIGLVASPLAAGLADPTGATAWVAVWSAWSVVLAGALGRAAPGSLTALRVAHPGLGIAAGVLSGGTAAVVVPLAAAAPAALAWRREVARSVLAPLESEGATIPFPPELVPPDVLSSAGLDDRGRPLGDQR